jgi:hypothetical protein
MQQRLASRVWIPSFSNLGQWFLLLRDNEKKRNGGGERRVFEGEVTEKKVQIPKIEGKTKAPNGRLRVYNVFVVSPTSC